MCYKNADAYRVSNEIKIICCPPSWCTSYYRTVWAKQSFYKQLTVMGMSEVLSRDCIKFIDPPPDTAVLCSRLLLLAGCATVVCKAFGYYYTLIRSK